LHSCSGGTDVFGNQATPITSPYGGLTITNATLKINAVGC